MPCWRETGAGKTTIVNLLTQFYDMDRSRATAERGIPGG
ncbi:hypothetical protein DOT_3555 [Desulfosporosinus sp. OT]|nr:hypothetical protein DOT_3555 [Desulfosporosinus sp. OT]